jgi:hypothetical protein
MDGRSPTTVVGDPRDRRVEGPVELEDSWAVAVASERSRVPRREAVARDAEKLAGHDVGEDDVGPRELVHPAARSDLAAELA